MLADIDRRTASFFDSFPLYHYLPRRLFSALPAAAFDILRTPFAMFIAGRDGCAFMPARATRHRYDAAG